MTPDEYINNVLQKYVVPTGPYSPAEQNANIIIPAIRRWASGYLEGIFFSGSYAKGTGVSGSADIDIFISLASTTPNTLGDNYTNLFNFASGQGWMPRRQNVSIGVTYNNTKIDLVPGRVQTGFQNFHSIYLNRQNSWQQTNVKLHIDKVVQSNRIKEIRAIKIWRNLHGLDFPSFYLELTVLAALSGKPISTLAQNVISVFEYLQAPFPTVKVEDPANTNNFVSNDLTLAGKQTIAAQARRSQYAGYWSQIIW